MYDSHTRVAYKRNNQYASMYERIPLTGLPIGLGERVL